MPEDFLDDRDRAKGGAIRSITKSRCLDLALDELNGCEDKRGKCAGESASHPEVGQRQSFLSRSKAAHKEQLATEALKEEETAGLSSSAHKRSTDTSI